MEIKPISVNSGIYQIQSVLYPERVYVGSAVNLRKRRHHHFYSLRKNKHENPKLQNHFNKYGQDDFVFEVIEEGVYLDNNHLLSREQGWYIPYGYKDTEIPYFNICKIAGSSKGRTQSDECKQKVSRANKGRKHTKESIRHMAEAQMGKVLSEEHKQKISIALKGKPKSEKGRENMSKAATGRTMSKESSRKKSLATKGKPHSDEHNKKVSIALAKWWRKKREQDSNG